MKVILLSNILEHAHFENFIRDTSKKCPDALFLTSGDLLNIFPEPGEDLVGSIFYDFYGDLLVKGMDDLVKSGFSNVKNSPFIKPLNEMFRPMGKYFKQANEKAKERYQRFFDKIAPNLQPQNHFFYIPGNMDYPYIGESVISHHPSIHQLDVNYFERDGVKIGGIGGIPNSVHPFRGVVEISPYEMSETEYERKLELLSGVDVLVTHVSPEEYPPLLRFLHQTDLKILICRAPFDFKKEHDFRGKLEHQQYAKGKTVIKVRPFDFPRNYAYVIDLNSLTISDPRIEMTQWQYQN